MKNTRINGKRTKCIINSKRTKGLQIKSIQMKSIRIEYSVK